ncbi:MAG: purine/pyrimidine permease [Synergistaceae bacterium]|jgi:uracil-xanthine permease|nr:purine/pyrimidine permease [Synergistaceae bacterium]
MGRKKVLFGIDDKPKLPVAILAGAQHVLTLFGATTLVPLICGPAMGMSAAQIAAFLGCVYFGMGVATLIQTWPVMGSGLPIVQGSSFSFIPPIITITGMYSAQGPDAIMRHVGGALIVGGIALAVIGYTGLVGRVRRIITPVVIGPTIMAIGFSLAQTAIVGNASKYWPISLLVVALVFFFSLVSKNRFFNIFAVLGAVVIAYLLCLAGSLAGVFPEGHAAYVNLKSVAEADWLRLKLIMPWGAPKFGLAATGAILAGFLCVMIESIGDYHSCAFAAGIDDPSEQQVSRGIGAEGLSCALSGIFGSVGTTSYTENIGLIGLTGVASRYVVRIGAVILILMSFLGKFGALVSTMPSPVIGGAYITLFGTIGALGIQNLMRADIGSQRNILIVGFAFLMSQGLPAWVEPNQAVFTESFLGSALGSTVWAILKTPMAVAAICAAVCDSSVPGTPEERGIADRK